MIERRPSGLLAFGTKDEPPVVPQPPTPSEYMREAIDNALAALGVVRDEEKTLNCMWHPEWSVGTCYRLRDEVVSIKCPVCHPEEWLRIGDLHARVSAKHTNEVLRDAGLLPRL